MQFQTPRGTRDFLPEEMIKREYVINTIKNVFIRFGFDPLETPVFEEFKLLSKKSGEDIKKQIYEFKDKSGRDLGLRFDLTVPMARVIANNPQLPKPFKRYAIAPVWRYEEVSAGRKREFYQCDVDIVGSVSMEADVEIMTTAVECFKDLGFRDFKVKVSDRKVLEGFIELIKKKIEPEMKLEFSSAEIFRIIDKLEKIGVDEVEKELKKLGLNEKQTEKLVEVILVKGNYDSVLRKGKDLLKGIKIAEEGLKELEEIWKYSKIYGIDKYLVLDYSMARGIDYYTGPIFETEVRGYEKYGSIASGGRYDNLIETFGGRPTPATGISLGIERIIEILSDGKKFNLEKTKVKLFVASVSEELKKDAVKIALDLRKQGISCQVDLMNRSLGKQFEFADSLGIPFVLVVGKEELKKNVYKLKDMKKKSEREVKLDQIQKLIS
ncbi:MAG: histidine--tRNA ligase [Candidatus Aenigmarchaeota archaeon]|nr:histidine--tRNA ligase [Candidatus Aenigmarchaeota archaeon]